MNLITKAAAAELMAAYAHSRDTGESGKKVIAKYFTPWANATWFITEGWPVHKDGSALTDEEIAFEEPGSETDWHLFGFCDLGDPVMAELGYVMLSDMKGLKGPAGLTVERDLYYNDRTIESVLKDYGRA